MAEIHYLISDASKKVDVEAHVRVTGRKNWNFQFPGMIWDTDIIRIFISVFLNR